MKIRSSINFHCLRFLIIVHSVVAQFSFDNEFDEGSPCSLNADNKDEKGICKKITECLNKLSEAAQGLRGPLSKDHCGFVNAVEIVCCPLQHIFGKFGLRYADAACQQFENEIPSSDGLLVHILGGDEAAEGEFPFMAALGYQDDSETNKSVIEYDCGGSLISTLYILTAAHCMVNINNKVPVEVRLGSVDLARNSQTVQRIQIAQLYPHPKYKISTKYYDIGLIQLRKPAQLSNTVRPICILTKAFDNDDTNNASLIVIGYGATSFDSERSSKLMKTPSLSLVNRSSCNETYTKTRKLPHGIDETMLCIKDKNTTRQSDACQGDSGGPLLLRKKNTLSLIGITSFGSGCGDSIPGVYTAIYPYLEWIESQVWVNDDFFYPDSIKRPSKTEIDSKTTVIFN